MQLPEELQTLADYIEPYESDMLSSTQSKAVTMKRDKEGVIYTAESFKLRNVVVNIKAILSDFEKFTQKSLDLLGIFASATSDRWILNVVAVLGLLKQAAELVKVEIEPQHAAVLVILYRMADGEFTVGIPKNDLERRVAQDIQSGLTADLLEDVIEDLIDLRCIRREKQHIYLNEKIILQG
ncbi:hypothetical protein [Candidatus Albibeggiatoa sp. nov. NOAA]|uniref:hypothetical protein n=1 Tax=Candidatus Albibeggiatoa sp. nov. NOAA TaxID=3162724 RepID=UPI0032FB399E|nr:hypothetical protein [Thiotrichaceae bacterium]